MFPESGCKGGDGECQCWKHLPVTFTQPPECCPTIITDIWMKVDRVVELRDWKGGRGIIFRSIPHIKPAECPPTDTPQMACFNVKTYLDTIYPPQMPHSLDPHRAEVGHCRGVGGGLTRWSHKGTQFHRYIVKGTDVVCSIVVSSMCDYL